MNETVLKSRADFFVANGFKDLGYEYINLDDCFIAPGASGRDANGNLVEDPTTFPSGMRSLSDYIHNLGLKFGVYTDRGTQTCAGRAAALGHEKQDAETYANKWAIDYLKEDSCHAENQPTTAFKEYGAMRDALNATGHPIFFSLCGWEPWYAPEGASLGNSWRIGPDDSNWPGILKNIDINADLAAYCAPGGWNDPCLLLSYDWTGKAVVTELQSRAQFSMWAIMSSPLLISGNPVAFSNYTMATYKNSKVIAVNQDNLGKQGTRISGGALSGGGSPFPRVHLDDCCDGTKCTGQQWKLDSPAEGYIQASSGGCVNADDCQSDVIVYDSCPTSGCCNDCDNMIFKLDAATGYIKAGAKADTCLGTSGDNALSLGSCTADFAKTFTYSNKTSQLQHVSPTTKSTTCLAEFNDGASGSNVWAKELSDGSYAVVFLNVGNAIANVTCDTTCFAYIGVTAGNNYNVEDLWDDAHKINLIKTATFTAQNLPASGGHLMVKISKS
jgi:hypothetical protein